MELYIGGSSQGKLHYVLQKKGYGIEQVSETKPSKNIREIKIWNGFHKWFRQELLDGNCPEDNLKEIADLIIISDEVGNGIVPMESFEREYRERLGRCLCYIAQRADCVERIACGIGQKIK